MSPGVDLSHRRRLHIVGVGGPGMSAMALALVGMGHEVSGSDVRESEVLDRVRGAGIAVSIGHSASVIVGCQAVTASPAIPLDNVEIVAAQDAGVFLSRAQMLASLCQVRPTVGVAGTHGKTTTSALLVRVMECAGLDPAFVVGGELVDEGTSARWGEGPWTIVEADESDGTHLQLPLAATILTNVDVDHLDHFGDFDSIVRSFRDYLHGIAGPKIVCLDDPGCRQVLSDQGMGQDSTVVTYGTSKEADVRVGEVAVRHGRTHFTIELGSHTGGRVAMSTTLRGLHNVSNITGVVAMARTLLIPMDEVTRAVETFSGVGRRFQLVGQWKGISFVDDYAHLPREIAAVLQAARSSDEGWRRVVAVFQPNRFNRMAVLSDSYADCFMGADVVVVTDIYASGTARIAGVTGEKVVEAIRRSHPDLDVRWAPRRDTLADFVAPILEEGDLCISMGCGDIETLPQELLAMMGKGPRID